MYEELIEQLMYKELIEQLRDGSNCDVLDCVDDAADAIEFLVAQLAAKNKEIEQLKNQYNALRQACDGLCVFHDSIRDRFQLDFARITAELDAAIQKQQHRQAKSESVRCVECKWWKRGFGFDLEDPRNPYGLCGITNYFSKDNHYCSYGKRRESENEK